MDTNPYRSPSPTSSYGEPGKIARRAALRRLRCAVSIMIVPAFFNLYSFNFTTWGREIDVQIHALYFTLNSIGLGFFFLILWIFGLRLFEFLAGGFYATFARRSLWEDWRSALFVIVRRCPYFAVFAAVLWAIWVVAFYQARFGYFTATVPAGFLATILLAAFLGPLFYRWYAIEQSARFQPMA